MTDFVRCNPVMAYFLICLQEVGGQTYSHISRSPLTDLAGWDGSIVLRAVCLYIQVPLANVRCLMSFVVRNIKSLLFG